jgi:DNA-binding HxlR family transcriptional regulator
MMFDLFASHKHDILEPLEQSDDNFQTLKRKLESLEEEMLNHSIRIN